MEEFMHLLRLLQIRAVAITISLMLLIASVFGLGLAIRADVVMLPPLELRHTTIHIAGYRTYYPECPPYTLCPPFSVVSHEYYVIWGIYEPPTVDQPYGRTARRLLVVTLPR
jgi:hypothetical protein